MKLSLVSYFFSPMENVASERWTRLSEELCKKGHELTVFTGPWGKSYRSEHSRLQVFCVGDPISQDQQKWKSQASSQGLSSWRRVVRAFLPSFLLIDGKWLWSLRVFWRLLFLKESPDRPDLVIVTGTPWSSVALTALACNLQGIPLAVDFRDHWSKEHFLGFRSGLARRYFAVIERWVVSHARLVISVNTPILDHLGTLNPSAKTLLLPHGFEGPIQWTPESFNDVSSTDQRLTYAGSISEYHGFERFLEVYRGKECFPLRVIGKDHTGILSGVQFEHLEQMPKKSLDQELRNSAVLLMSLAPESVHYTTGKLMTYFQAGRPILYWGPPQSPAAQLILKHRMGWVIDCASPKRLREALQEIHSHLREGRAFDFNPDFSGISEYSLNKLAARLEEQLRAYLQ